MMVDRQIKILLIEDNPGDTRLIEEMLSEVSGTLFDVENADRLSDGLTRIQKGGIDAVLLDLGLPDSAGLDTFEKVHDQAPELPIVMLTGLDDTELALEGMRMGAQDYLVKGRADGDLLARTLRYAIERKAAEARIEHLNSVLKAIRNVNQLIVAETERGSLLKKSCDALVDARGYDAAWLGFLGDDVTFDLVVGSGFREDIAHFSDRVAGGDHPPCIRDALSQKEQVLVIDTTDVCRDCFFTDACLGRATAVIRVEHGGRLFGLLAVSFAPDVAVDEEEEGLLAEVASDIGIALHNIEMRDAHKVAEDALLESEEKYKTIYDSSIDAIMILTPEEGFLGGNSAAIKMFGCKGDEEFTSKTPADLSPVYQPDGTLSSVKAQQNMTIAMKKGSHFFEWKHKRIDGREFFATILLTRIELQGKKILQATVRDITERKKAEDQIKQSLQEKEVLLREIHHRVKNNLQVVSSLLNMQARNARDKNTIEILSEARDRIRTMSLIHSQLYDSSDLAEINMKGFVDLLLGQLLQSYPVGDARITHVVRVDDYPFPISTAVPVGLIINELLSNALKHAFNRRDEGEIEISLTASERCGINLTVSDDGVGLPRGFDIDESKTLGLRLVKILAEDQLQGTLEVTNNGGATFRIEFETKTG